MWAVALRLAEGDWTRWGESPHRKWDWVGMDDRAVLAQQWVPTAEWLRANPAVAA